MKEKHIKLVWVCDSCNWVTISDSREHHKMDFCTCGKSGVDLESYSLRFSAKDFTKLRILARFKEGDKWRYCRK